MVDILLSHDPSQIQRAYRASVIAARLGNVPRLLGDNRHEWMNY